MYETCGAIRTSRKAAPYDSTEKMQKTDRKRIYFTRTPIADVVSENSRPFA